MHGACNAIAEHLANVLVLYKTALQLYRPSYRTTALGKWHGRHRRPASSSARAARLVCGRTATLPRPPPRSLMSSSTVGRTVKLANGVEIPTFGFGCAFGDWSSEAAGAGKAALLPEGAYNVKNYCG
eukprot:COSAG01_NODE_3339_length_6232_cov_10.685309_9_plen_127_part_00